MVGIGHPRPCRKRILCPNATNAFDLRIRHEFASGFLLKVKQSLKYLYSCGESKGSRDMAAFSRKGDTTVAPTGQSATRVVAYRHKPIAKIEKRRKFVKPRVNEALQTPILVDDGACPATKAR